MWVKFHAENKKLIKDIKNLNKWEDISNWMRRLNNAKMSILPKLKFQCSVSWNANKAFYIYMCVCTYTYIHYVHICYICILYNIKYIDYMYLYIFYIYIK